MKTIKLSALFLFVLNIAQASQPAISFVDSSSTAPKDTSWKTSGFIGLNASQTTLSNWQGGGQNNIAMNAILNYDAVYQKKTLTWSNKLTTQYGLIRIGDGKLFQKNVDQLFALSKLNIDAFHKNWYYAVQADFRSQLAPGYNYSGDSIEGRATSDFFSPAYIQLAIGLDYKPAPYFSAMIAPIAGKVTTVQRQYLADQGAYGVEPAKFDNSGTMTASGKKVRYEMGGRIVLKFKKDIAKNVNWDSYLDLFSNYLKKPQNIDVIFNNILTFKINKYLNASIICQMVYDDDIIIKRDWNKDGLYDNPNDFSGPRLQALTTLGIGFGYKF